MHNKIRKSIIFILLLISIFFIFNKKIKETTKSIDHSTVPTFFDKSDLPSFQNNAHAVNWFLDRNKPQKVQIVNTLSTPISCTLVAKSFFKESVSLTLPPHPLNKIHPQGWSLKTFKKSDDKGNISLVQTQTTNLFKNTIKNFLSERVDNYFLQKRIVLEANEATNISINSLWFVRSIQCEAPLKIQINTSHVKCVIGENLSGSDIKNNLKEIYKNEFFDKTMFRAEKAYAFDDWNGLDIDKTWHTPHKKFLLHFYDQAGLTTENVATKRRIIIKNAKRKLLEATPPPHESLYKIPLIMHKIWITSNDKPFEIPHDRLAHYLKQIQLWPQFTHHLWVLDATKIPQTINALKNYPVEIHELKEIWPDFMGKQLFTRLFNDYRYVACSDITRVNLLCLKGGIYADFGVEFHFSPALLCQKYSAFTCREGYLLGNTCMGSAPGYHIFKKILLFWESIENTPNDLRLLGDKNPLIPWVSYGILTAMFDVHSSEEEDYTPILLGGAILSTNHMSSWGGGNTFGNRSLSPSNNVWFGP